MVGIRRLDYYITRDQFYDNSEKVYVGNVNSFYEDFLIAKRFRYDGLPGGKIVEVSRFEDDYWSTIGDSHDTFLEEKSNMVGKAIDTDSLHGIYLMFAKIFKLNVNAGSELFG